MELDDIKTAWLNLDKKLEHQQILNEKLIRQIASEKSENRLGKIIRFEGLGQVLNFGILLYVALRFQKLDSTFLQISGIGLFIGIFAIAFLAYTLYQKINKIDIQNAPLIEVLNNMADFKKYYYTYKKWASILSMIEIMFLVPIIIKLVHNSNLFEHFWHFAIPIMIGLAIGTILMFWTYKHLYEKNIEAVEKTLKDLKQD